MPATANPEQYENWNGESGRRWVAAADQRDTVLAPVADVLLDAARATPGSQVLDVGCGCGATTLAVGTTVGDGSVLGVDLSGPMLEVARERARRGGAENVTFRHGDAQVLDLEREAFDLAVSRFGTLFFGDQRAAFENVGAALRRGARLCLATWRPLEANDWLVVPRSALRDHVPLPDPDDAGTPGMFAQSDPTTVTATLTAAGFGDIDLEPVDVALNVGATPDEALDYLAGTGPIRLLLERLPEGPARDAARAEIRGVLSEHDGEDGVTLTAAIWLVRARR